MSNPTDQQNLLTPTYRNTIARAIAEGIMAYFNAVKRAHNLNP